MSEKINALIASTGPRGSTKEAGTSRRKTGIGWKHSAGKPALMQAEMQPGAIA